MAVEIPVIELGVSVVLALVLGMVFQKSGFSSSLGYIFAGMLLGPVFAGYMVPGEGLAPIFGEIGILMLLFYLGLELNIKKIAETGGITLILSGVHMVFAFVFGFLAAKFFGFSDLEAVVIGSLIPMASTAIIAKFIMEKGLLQSIEARLSISSLVFEDFFGIFVLVLISSLASKQASLQLVLNGLLFVIAMFYIVSKLSTRILGALHSYKQEDKMILFAIGVLILASYFGGMLGLSPILGAYFAGFALSESVYGERIKRELGFFREFFLLFFFVSFGSTVFYNESLGQVVLPVAGELTVLFGLLALMLIGYWLSDLIGFAVVGTALGLDAKTAMTTSLLMSIAIGEFSVIIANTAAPLVPHGSMILSLAFVLVISTSILGPLLFRGSNFFTELFLKLYPKRVRKAMQGLGKGIISLEKVFESRKVQSEYVVALKNLVKNLLIAFAIVYVSYVANIEFSLPFLPFIPPRLSLSVLILPLVIWPVYKFLEELKFLAKKVSSALIEKSFHLRKPSLIEEQASEIITGIFLTLIGFLSVTVIYHHFDIVFLIIPAAYTVLAAMYLSRAFYGLFEKYETLESVASTSEDARRLLHLTQEFDEHSQRFRSLREERMKAKELIQEAIQAGKIERARALLHEFKVRETRQLIGLLDLPTILRETSLFRKITGIESPRTRDALKKYVLHYPLSPDKGFAKRFGKAKSD
jgi:CPA2 family monovalent cation:H+ antiporter-2